MGNVLLRPLEDPAGLINASIDGKVRRAIEIHEKDKIDENAFKCLIRVAVTLNESSTRGRAWWHPCPQYHRTRR